MKIHVTYLAVILALASLAGVAARIAVNNYGLYEHLLLTTLPRTALEHDPFQRVGVITGIHPPTGEVTLKVRNPITNDVTEIRAQVTESTRIGLQNPLFDHDVLIGFEVEKPGGVQDLVVGARVQGRFVASDSGRLVLNRILIGSPFPRF